MINALFCMLMCLNCHSIKSNLSFKRKHLCVTEISHTQSVESRFYMVSVCKGPLCSWSSHVRHTTDTQTQKYQEHNKVLHCIQKEEREEGESDKEKEGCGGGDTKLTSFGRENQHCAPAPDR